MAQTTEPFIIDTEAILETLERQETLREQAWSMALERAYAIAESKFSTKAFKGRLERAIYLVETGNVIFDESNRLWVKSESRPDTSYLVQNQPCLCEDSQKEAAPNGFCKHRIAAFIFAQAHVQQGDIMATDPADEQYGNPNGNGAPAAPLFDEEAPSDEPEAEPQVPHYEPQEAQPQYYTLSDAPAKATVKWRDEQGIEVWIVIQDFDDRTLLERVNKYRQYASGQVIKAERKGIEQFGTPRRAGGGKRPSGPKLRCEDHGVDYFKAATTGDYIHKKEDGKWCKALPGAVKEFEQKHGLTKAPENFGDPPPMSGS